MERDDLDWIPGAVRDKLDQVGIKLHLREWQAFCVAERQELCSLPCQTQAEKQEFRERLDALALQRCGALPQRMSKRKSRSSMGEEA